MFITERTAHAHLLLTDGARDRAYVVLPVKRLAKTFPVVLDSEYYDKLNAGSREWAFVNGHVCAADTGDRLSSLVRGGGAAATSAVHINMCAWDHRFANLATAPAGDLIDDVAEDEDMADADLPAELRALGITRLPAHVRWDDEEERFTFEGHPYAGVVAVTPYGSGSTRRTRVEKLASCLKRYVAMHAKHAPLEASEEALKEHRRLASSFNSIVRHAHAADPATYPTCPLAPLRPIREDHALALDILTMLPEQGDDVPGTTTHTHVPHGEATVARVFDDPDKRPTLFDQRHEAALAPLSWDPSDLRINVNPAVTASFPRVAELFPGVKKVPLAAFVYHVLEGNEVLPGRVLEPFNTIRSDVRAANLLYVEADAKLGGKPPASLEPPTGVDIGMKYLPRGVTIGKERNRLVFIVRPAMKRTAFRRAEAKRVFETSVLPKLREVDPDFDEKNARYQTMVEEALSFAAPA